MNAADDVVCAAINAGGANNVAAICGTSAVAAAVPKVPAIGNGSA